MTGRPGLSSSHPAVLKSPVARSSASAPRPPDHTALQVHIHPQFYLLWPPFLPPSLCQSWAGESWSDWAGQVPDMRSASGSFHTSSTRHGEDGHHFLGLAWASSGARPMPRHQQRLGF